MISIQFELIEETRPLPLQCKITISLKKSRRSGVIWRKDRLVRRGYMEKLLSCTFRFQAKTKRQQHDEPQFVQIHDGQKICATLLLSDDSSELMQEGG